MKNLLTNNIGLKIASVLIAIALWVVIVNVDDPIISKSYSGIQVEMTNGEVISNEEKTYEVIDGSDVVSVTVTAKRSIIENMSRDYIKATADLRQLTFMNTVPIEFKSSRYSDQIESISSRTTNVQVEIEDRISRQFKVMVDTTGQIADGYVSGVINPMVSAVTVLGPKSVVENISEARILVNLDGMNESFVNSSPVQLRDEDGEIVVDNMISLSTSEIRTQVEVLETKEIPITASVSGTPASGFSATGTVICEPSSVVVAGLGSSFESLSAINIPETDFVVDGVSENAYKEVNIKKYLPAGVRLADLEDSGEVGLTAVVEAHEIQAAVLYMADITIENVPEGYEAKVVSNSLGGVAVTVSGLPDDLSIMDTWQIKGTIDATTLVPKEDDSIIEEESEEEEEESEIYVGMNEGVVVLELPEGIVQTDPVVVQVVVSPVEETESEE